MLPKSMSEAAMEIVAAFVANNAVPQNEMPSLIFTVHQALAKITAPVESSPKPIPAVDPKKAVTKDWIVCLEDGKKFKSLRRHLMTAFGLSPEAYREKWGLPLDSPMVAPSYAATRSELAKASGLGQKAARISPKASSKKK